MAIELLRDLVPISVRHWVWQERMLRRAPDVTHDDVERVFARIAPTIDGARLRRLYAAHRDAPRDLVEACDHERKLRIAIVKALLAGLHRTRPLRILDIGHGGGYFVTVCRRLGHHANGTEVPLERLPPRSAALYAQITDALGFHDQHRLLVQRFTPLAIDGEYDLINAHKICFNDHGKATEWGLREWRYFVADARTHLAPGGRLMLELNENLLRYGHRRWYDEETRAFFAAVGTVDDHRITIRQKS